MLLRDRKLNKAMIARLSACTFIQDANNIIIQGATGTGKTYLSCALGVSANRNFYPAKYFPTPGFAVRSGECKDKWDVS